MQATIHINDEVEQAFRHGYLQGKKEATRIIDELDDRLDQAFSDAVNDAQDYNNPNVAQDALQDAYDNVRSWIYEILNGRESGDNRCG